MSQRFSSGEHAEVFVLEGSRPFEGREADLVRNAASCWNTLVDAKLIFYAHRISGLLFPGHFMDVTGARMQGRVTQLFSRRADVPRDHANYSVDIVKPPMQKKISLCACSECRRHREFHASNNLEFRAQELAKKCGEFGISMHASDCTDYCQTREGNVIFFDAHVTHQFCRPAVQNADMDEGVRSHVLSLLDRVASLEAQKKRFQSGTFHQKRN